MVSAYGVRNHAPSVVSLSGGRQAQKIADFAQKSSPFCASRLSETENSGWSLRTLTFGVRNHAPSVVSLSEGRQAKKSPTPRKKSSLFCASQPPDFRKHRFDASEFWLLKTQTRCRLSESETALEARFRTPSVVSLSEGRQAQKIANSAQKIITILRQPAA